MPTCHATLGHQNLKRQLGTGALQPCSQMVMVHMGTDDGTGGRGSLGAPLGPAVIDQLAVTNINTDGYHLIGNTDFNWGKGQAREGPLFWYALLVLLSYWLIGCTLALLVC